MMKITIEAYTPSDREAWNRHVTLSKNSHFQFQRDYMEYHADRFTDASLLFKGDDGELLGVLPANRNGETVISHAGLSFGGLVVRAGIKPPTVLAAFEALAARLRSEAATKLLYKALPRFYHTQPAEEDLYALFRLGAKIYRRDVTSVVPLSAGNRFDYNRERSIKRGREAGVEVRPSEDLPAYFEILTAVLEARHGVRPVHTLGEMRQLVRAFPEHIRLYGAFHQERMVAGSIIYENKHVAHAQYIANSEAGRKICALDVLFSDLIHRYTGKMTYFDFGTSNEKDGMFLNEGLVNHKSGFGAGAMVHDYYAVDLTQVPLPRTAETGSL